jgi:N-methylhydantoinase B
MHAAPFGTAVNLTIGGYDPVLQRRYVFYFYNGGGHGASADGDGLSNASTATGMSRTPPIEICEQQTPVRFDQYSLRADSGGAGQFQGGLGVSYTLKIVRGDGRLQLMGDRGKRGPFGIEQGLEAAKTNIVIMQSGRRYDPPMIAKDENVQLSAGDTVTVEPPGGGGYGSPGLRDPKAVETDLLRGYITQAYAERHYGKTSSDK